MGAAEAIAEEARKVMKVDPVGGDGEPNLPLLAYADAAAARAVGGTGDEGGMELVVYDQHRT